MEKIKIGNIICELIANGAQLSNQGGEVIFQPGSNSFDAIETAVKTAKEIVVLDEAGDPILTRSDLVYGGRLAKDDNYAIGTEQVENGADESGNPVYETKDIIGTVMIAGFRIPDLREQLAATQAKLEYVAMMSGIEMEV